MYIVPSPSGGVSLPPMWCIDYSTHVARTRAHAVLVLVGTGWRLILSLLHCRKLDWRR